MIQKHKYHILPGVQSFRKNFVSSATTAKCLLHEIPAARNTPPAQKKLPQENGKKRSWRTDRKMCWGKNKQYEMYI